MTCGTSEKGTGMDCSVRGTKGGGVAGSMTSFGSVMIFGSLSLAMGDGGMEGPGDEDRSGMPTLMDVGREGALKGRESDCGGNSSEVMRAGGLALIGGVGAYGGAGFVNSGLISCCTDTGGCCWGSATGSVTTGDCS